jgi:uncharacterized membrane protein AbrB (regulator of aidB expression)
MPSKTQLWYRWHFNLGTLLIACLFGWMSWDSLIDATAEWPTRVLGFVVFGLVGVVFVWFLWRNLKTIDRTNKTLDFDKLSRAQLARQQRGGWLFTWLSLV